MSIGKKKKIPLLRLLGLQPSGTVNSMLIVMSLCVLRYEQELSWHISEDVTQL